MRSDGWEVFSPQAQAYQWCDANIFPEELGNIKVAYRLSNLRATHDAVVEALTGIASTLSQSTIDDVGSFVQANAETNFKIFGRQTTSNGSILAPTASRTNKLPSSLVLGSAMADFDEDDFTAVNLTITEQNLNSILQNVTISLMSTPNTNRTIVVQRTDNQNVYVFAEPVNLIAPYTLGLVLSTVFAYIGMRSLYANDCSAMVGGVLQILCATQGSEIIHRFAVEAGRNNATRESREVLCDLKIRLGRLCVGVDGEDVIGFGTRAELMRS